MSSQKDKRFISLCNRIFPCLSREKGDGDHQETSHNSVCSSGVSMLLPDSAIIQILLKLPVKSIIRCRCVCKSWYQLIVDPYFANLYSNQDLPPFSAITHLQRPSNLTDIEAYYLLETGKTTGGEFILTPFNLKPRTLPRIEISGNTVGAHTSLVGSCNGLICLVDTPYHRMISYDSTSFNYQTSRTYNDQTVSVINPLLGEFVMMPKVDRAKEISNVIYGFGSTVNEENYKIVRIIIKSDQLVGKILTIGVDRKWRDFDNSSFPSTLYSNGITLNGVLHWGGHDSEHSRLIYAFNIRDEIGKCIKLPHGVVEPSRFSILLAVWNGNLCVIDSGNRVQVELWTMKQYGVVESWTKDIIVPNSSIPSLYPLMPVTTTTARRNRENLWLFRQYGRSLFSFDPNMNNCVEIEICGEEEIISYLYEYIPSFFSLGHSISRHHTASKK